MPWQAILGTLGTVLGAYLVYRGGRFTAVKAKEGVDTTVEQARSERAFSAWEALVTPMQKELDRVRGQVERLTAQLDEEREERREKERHDEEDRATAKRLVTEQLEALQGQVDTLRDEVKSWKRVAQTIARWATTMRDELIRTGGKVPATPDELLTLTAIQEAEDS